MVFVKNDPRINRRGRPKLPEQQQPTVSSGDPMLDVINELLAIARNPKLAPTARVTALNSYLVQLRGRPRVAAPQEDRITEPTALRLADLTERILIPRRTRCAKCNTHLVVDGKGNSTIDDRPDTAPVPIPERSAPPEPVYKREGQTLLEQEEDARRIEETRKNTTTLTVQS